MPHKLSPARLWFDYVLVKEAVPKPIWDPNLVRIRLVYNNDVRNQVSQVPVQ